MINGLTRYVFWQLFLGLVLVVTALTCVVWLTQSLRFVDMIVNSGLSAGAFVHLTGLMIPNFLTAIVPAGVFIITTFTYHRLIMDRELVVMRAAGLGPASLAKPAVLLALLMVTAGYALSTYLAPSSWAQFREMRWDARYNFSNVLLREGTFNEAGRNVTVYVRERTDDGQLIGLMAHIDNQEEGRSETWMAERGALTETEHGPRVVMFNGSRQDFDSETKQLTILYFDQSVLDLDAPASDETGERHREPRERSMADLIDLDTTDLDAPAIGKFKVELHNRLVAPWSALGFAMIALGVLMTGSFSRRGEGKRVILAVLLAATYQGVLLAVPNAAAKNTDLMPVLYLVTALPIVLGALVLMAPGLFNRASNRISAPPAAMAKGAP